jgi:hypothetical protein
MKNEYLKRKELNIKKNSIKIKSEIHVKKNT